jgi:actin-related protein 6
MGFQRFCTAPAPLLAYADHRCWDPDSVLSRTGCGIVVDSGFSFTHTVPIYEGRIVYKACRRIDLGGKALTNLLKETISNRHFNMMDETVLVNGIKERLCFVSTRLDEDLRTCKKRGGANAIRRLYCLPTGLQGQDRLGHVVDPEQEGVGPALSTSAEGGSATPASSPSKRVKLEAKEPGAHASKSHSAQGQESSAGAQGAGEDDMEEAYLDVGNERFTVPEVLFAPHMVGMRQCGIHHTIASSISLLDPDLHSLLYSTIVAYGGNANMPGTVSALPRGGGEGWCAETEPDEFRMHLPTLEHSLLAISQASINGLTLKCGRSRLTPLTSLVRR